MALQKQTISLPFTHGADTKTDPKLATKFSRLENLVMRGGTPKRRWGTSQLSTSIDSGGNFTSGDALFTYENELLRVTSGTLYGYSPNAAKWTAKPGGGHYCSVAKEQLVRNNRTQSGFDQAIASNISCVAWIEAGGNQAGLHIQVRDESSGEVIQSGALAVASTSTVSSLRVVACGSNLVILWNIPAGGLNFDVYSAYVSASAPATLSAPVRIYAALGFGFQDAVANSTTIFLQYGLNTMATLNSTGAVNGAPAPVTFGAITLPGLQLALDSLGHVFVLLRDTVANHFKFRVYDTSLNVVTGVTDIGASFGANTQGTLVESATPGVCTWFGMVASTDFVGGENSSFAGGAIKYDGTIITAQATINNGMQLTAPATRAVLFDGVACMGITASLVGGTLASTVQNTFFVIDPTGNVVARALTNASGMVNNRFSSPIAIGSSVGFLAPEQGRLTYQSSSGTSTNVTPSGVSRVLLTPTPVAQLPIIEMGDTAYIGGGCPRVYDGQRIAEAGFHTFPEVLVITAAGGGSLSTGSYQYRALYSWLNARGELVRSIVSPAITVSATSGDKVTLIITGIGLTQKDSAENGVTVQVEVYRTEADGTVFYRATSATAPTYNSGSSSVSVVDQLADSDLIAEEILYTTGGILDNEPPAPYSIACAFKNRIFIAGLEDPYEVRYSSQVIAGEQLRWATTYRFRVPSETGQVTALAAMDDKLVIFTAQTFYIQYGDGPDLLGNNTYGAPQAVVGSESGCISAPSVCEGPNGLFYQGKRGILLLDRSLSTTYIGADIEFYGTNTIRDAVLKPESSEVWFLTDNGSDLPGQALGGMATGNGGTCLVYNYFYNQWSYHPSYGGQEFAFFLGNWHHIRSDGVVFKENPNTYQDSGVGYATVQETAWVKPSGLVKGFQRIWRASLLGNFCSRSTLVWDTAYNYSTVVASEPFYSDSVTFTGSSAFSVGQAFDIRHHLATQKCEAMKFRFTDTPSGGTGQGVELVSMDLEFGIKVGSFKLPAAQSV